MHYALWHTRSNNLIATFDTEREALLFLKEVILEQGDDIVEGFYLIEDHADDDDPENDEWRSVGEGLELADLARATN